MSRRMAANGPWAMSSALRWIKIKRRSKAMPGENLANAIAEVRAIYQELAKRPVQRNCIARTECCQFQLTGLTPHLTKGEALLAAKAFRAAGRKELPEADDGICPMLKRGTGHC